MIGVNDNNLCMPQDGLKNMVSIHLATMSPTSTRHCYDSKADRKNHCSEEESSLDEDTGKHQGVHDSNYAVDRTVRHFGCGPGFRYVV